MISLSLFVQFDMAMVQLAFFGSFVTFPKAWGGRFASEDDLLSLVHFWRVMGYYMGIKDK